MSTFPTSWGNRAGSSVPIGAEIVLLGAYGVGMSKWLPDDEQEPCHACGTLDGVQERFVVTNPTPCLAGVMPKAVGYLTWGCDPCWTAYRDQVAA